MSLSDDKAKSEDLQKDITLMWETQGIDVKFDSPSITQRHASTDQAICAASRVFNTVALIGKTQQQVIDLLGDPQISSNSIYNFPFWPPPANALVYRFDNGQCGWQFNILMDHQNRVLKLERLWIH